MLHDIIPLPGRGRKTTGNLFATIGLAAAAAWALPAAQAADIKIQPAPGGIVQKLPARACPDPAAVKIDFQIIKRYTPFTAGMRIVGTVKNLGSKPYLSSPGQQTIYLSVEGVAAPVAQRTFHKLAPGQEVTVSFTRNWNSASPAEGEFPPSYMLWIGYDPDIAIDGNPQNDDCNGQNNKLKRSGDDINAMLH
jgi:hypothetical protein